jgi:hypothetical protein
MQNPSFHPIEPFVEQVPVDTATVLCEAMHYRRQDYPAADAMRFALQRDYSRRLREAQPAYEASMDPLTRELRAINLQLELLREKLLGKRMWERQNIISQMHALYQRLNELQPLREAAE